MTAYLALLQSSVQPKLKVASTWATSQLLAKGYDEVMRALRYGGTRRQHGNFGDHIWIFFIFNIQQNGKGIHFTCIGINTVERSYTYYDYAKWNRERNIHMNAVKDFLDFIDSSNPGATSEWTAHYDGTQDMVTQGQYSDCGPGTCFIIEAIVSNIPLSHFTVEGIHQGRFHFAHCLLRQSVPPLSGSLVSIAESTIRQSVTLQEPEDGSDRTILHEEYEYDPFRDDEAFGPEQTSAVVVTEHHPFLFRVPGLQHHQITEIIEKSGLSHSFDLLRPESSLPIIGTDLQDLIKPTGITDVLLQQFLLDALGDRTDVTICPAHMTRFILGFNGIITKQVESDKRYEELKSLQRELVCHRYVIIICWEYNHFTGIIVDKGGQSMQELLRV